MALDQIHDEKNAGRACIECGAQMLHTGKMGNCGCDLIRRPQCGATEASCGEIYPREVH